MKCLWAEPFGNKDFKVNMEIGPQDKTLVWVGIRMDAKTVSLWACFCACPCSVNEKNKIILKIQTSESSISGWDIVKDDSEGQDFG